MTSDTIEQLESELKRKNRQCSILLQLAQIAAEPGGKGHIVRRTLEVICSENGWLLGQCWLMSETENVSRCAPWYFSSANLPEFRAASVDRRFSKGVGLPGRVWATGLPLLIDDIELETGLGFPRKVAALKGGLKSAFGFAIKNGPFVTGVLEFFDIKPMSVDHTENAFYEKIGKYVSTLISDKEREAASRQSEELNKIVLSHAYHAFISISEASLITQWTSKATALFGWEPEEVLGKPLHEIIIPERFRDAHMKGIFRYQTTKEGVVVNRRVRAPALHRDGQEIPVELLIFPIETSNSKSFGAFIVDCSRPLEPELTLE